MKIAVCVKQVPDTETRVRIADGGKGIVESDVNWIVSPYDEFAIEEALKIKEAKGGEVVLVSVGPDRVQSALRNGLAMGADSAVHLKDAAFEGLDPLGTARVLAAAVKALAPDLVLCGQQGAVGAAEPERVAERVRHLGLARRVGHEVEVALGVGVLVVDGGRQHVVPQGQHADHRLDDSLA